MKLSIRVSIEPEYQNGQYEGQGNLQLSEEFHIQTGSFLEICHVLGQFQELADRLKPKVKP